MVRLFSKLCIIIGLLLGQPLQAATISVSVDRNPVQLNESFTLIFQSDDNVDAEPDFTPLKKEFEILSKGQSSNIQITNGSMTRQTRWNVNAIAKHAGNLAVPSIAFGRDRSQPITLKVVEQQQNSNNDSRADVFVETRLDRTTAYVQSQLLYTIRFYRAVNINGATMSEPQVEGGEVVMEKLGDDAVFETQRQGRRYAVVERKYALFPQQSGQLSIKPITMNVQVLESMRSNLDPFGRNTIIKRISSESLIADIKPIPTSMQGKPWIPASSAELSESWSEENHFVVGEPVTRTLTLQATGLSGPQLPELMPTAIEGFKIYPDQANVDNQLSANGLVGVRQEKLAMIPLQAGTLTLPAVEVTWWNINSNQMEIAKLPARTITVQASNNVVASPAAPLMPSSAITEQPTTAPNEVEAGPWFTIAMVFGLGWLLTGAAWLLKSRQRSTTTAQTPQPTNTTSLKFFFRACEQNDATLARKALLQWAQANWPDNAPLGLDEVTQRLGEHVAPQVLELNRALYANNNASWNGSALKQAVAEATKSLQHKSAQSTPSALPTLYPNG